MSLWRFLKHDLWIPWQSFAKDVHIEKKYLWRSIQKKYALWPMWLTCYLNALQTHYCASTFKILWTKYSEDFWMKWFILLHFSPFGISFTMYVDLRRLTALSSMFANDVCSKSTLNKIRCLFLIYRTINA